MLVQALFCPALYGMVWLYLEILSTCQPRQHALDTPDTWLTMQPTSVLCYYFSVLRFRLSTTIAIKITLDAWVAKSRHTVSHFVCIFFTMHQSQSSTLEVHAKSDFICKSIKQMSIGTYQNRGCPWQHLRTVGVHGDTLEQMSKGIPQNNLSYIPYMFSS